MADEKVAVIGAGQVGATVAQRLLERNVSDVVLIDVVPGLAEGKALDLMQSAALLGIERRVTGGTEVELLEGSNVVVVTAGKPRQPGMSRENLLKANAEIVSSLAEAVARHAPESKIVVVTNPLDVMTYLLLMRSQFRPERVMGMAGALDSARFAFFVADELGVSPSQVSALVLGSHGDQMVPLPRLSTVGGVPLSELLPEGKIAEIVESTRAAGGEIVKLLKAGSAFYAPSAAVVRMVEALFGNTASLFTASVLLGGEYGLEDVAIGVPVKLGNSGVEEIIELDLSPEEQSALRISSEKAKEGIYWLRSKGFLDG